MEKIPGQSSMQSEQENPREDIFQSSEQLGHKIELSESTIEKILEKARDVTASGIPFTVIGEYHPYYINETLERKKEDIAQRRKTYEKFKKDALDVGSRMSYEVPLASYSPEDIYRWYVSTIKDKDESEEYRDDYFKRLGIADMGLSMGKPTKKAEFMEKYNFELAKQKDAFESQLQHEYQEYLQDLEDEIYGASPERYKRKYKDQQFSYMAGRRDLLTSNLEDPEDGIKSLYRNYVDLMTNKKKGGGWSEIYKSRLARLGLYRPILEGEVVEEEMVGDNEYEDEDDYDDFGDPMPESKFAKAQSEVLSEEEFTERYLAALKEQDAMLDVEGEKAYEEYINKFRKGGYGGRGLETLKLILQNGIFGGRRWDKQQSVSMEPSEWAKDVRQKRTDRKVYFNMAGHFHNEITQITPKKNLGIGDSFFFRRHNQEDQPNDGIAIVFDKKGLRYNMDDPNFSNGYYHQGRLPAGPDSQYGYAGPARVAPRRFEGIVISCTDTVKQKSDWAGEVKVQVYSTNKEKWRKYADDVASVMMEVDKDHPDRLVPIYDIHGNMLWPVEMSKEEIKEKLEIKKPNE
jgi:hypothetical protein